MNKKQMKTLKQEFDMFINHIWIRGFDFAFAVGNVLYHMVFSIQQPKVLKY